MTLRPLARFDANFNDASNRAWIFKAGIDTWLGA
jgi:hypothetical protein